MVKASGILGSTPTAKMKIARCLIRSYSYTSTFFLELDCTG